MDLELREAVVLLTGGSKGIGLACAKAFAAEGARVAIASRDPANLGTAASQLQKSFLLYPFDAADEYRGLDVGGRRGSNISKKEHEDDR